MTEVWPTVQEVVSALRQVQTYQDGEGWRSMAEIAGILECPEFARISQPAEEGVALGALMKRSLGPEGPTLYRAI